MEHDGTGSKRTECSEEMDSEVSPHLKLAGGRFTGGRTKDADGNSRKPPSPRDQLPRWKPAGGGADEETRIRCDGEESAKKWRFARGAEAFFFLRRNTLYIKQPGYWKKPPA
jgi:hypothetical protein